VRIDERLRGRYFPTAGGGGGRSRSQAPLHRAVRTSIALPISFPVKPKWLPRAIDGEGQDEMVILFRTRRIGFGALALSG
jgi:hypothetical protein